MLVEVMLPLTAIVPEVPPVTDRAYAVGVPDRRVAVSRTAPSTDGALTPEVVVMPLT